MLAQPVCSLDDTHAWRAVASLLQLDATSITITFYDEKLVNLYNTTIVRVPDGAGGHR